jgi:hypothetical protein
VQVANLMQRKKHQRYPSATSQRKGVKTNAWNNEKENEKEWKRDVDGQAEDIAGSSQKENNSI